MANKILKFIIISILLYSCSDDDKQAKINKGELDKLINTNISITKGNQKVVNATAKELLRDNAHIHLKADYLSEESNDIRSELSSQIILNPNQTNRIKSLAEDLHIKGGNIKAEFYDEYNNISSVLYSDSAKIHNTNNSMIAMGNVIIYSPVTNLMLLGHRIEWLNKIERIRSEKDNVTIVKIMDDDKLSCVQKSTGFESDMDLSNYIFYNPTGKISEDCF